MDSSSLFLRPTLCPRAIPPSRSKQPFAPYTTRQKRPWSDFGVKARDSSSEVSVDGNVKVDDFDFKDFAWPSPGEEVPFWKRKLPSWGVSLNVPDDTEKDQAPLHVMHVTAEMAPIAKVGGLGDVVTGLARACLSRGHNVEIMLPFYECIDRRFIVGLELVTAYNSFHDENWVSTNAYRGAVSGIPVIFIEPSNQFFKGMSIYGGSYNELEAYLFFSRACLEWMQVNGVQPDIVHVHEWQTCALPLLYWDMYHYLSLQKSRITLTIHNMEHYGECRQEQLSKCGLDGSIYATIEKAVDDRTIGHNPERLSLLKGGIVYSNAVVTVSPTYLKETICSGWLANTLMRNRDKYFGILNGIDTEMWNPATDACLPARFNGRAPRVKRGSKHLKSAFNHEFDDGDSTAEKLEGKKLCKCYVQKGLGLGLEGEGSSNIQDILNETQRVPLVICITRLVAQKGLHLIRQAIKHVEELGGQMVLLGKAPDGRVESEFKDLADVYNRGHQIRILLLYSEELSHLLYAAADLVLVPSLYEPCGLAQMIGMRYGAIPVVRKTGGLADTVFDIEDESKKDMANGFIFEGIDEGSINWALDRAFTHYRERPEEWAKMVVKVMEIDNSWNRTAGNYIQVYNSIRVY